LKGYKVKASKEHESTFQTFDDLEVYKKTPQFRKQMYGAARKLPDFERFELGKQVGWAAVSLTNNIAEGHGRYHYLDQIRFQLQARGSLAELLDDLNVCQGEDYLAAAEIVELKERAKEVQRLINGYIRFLRSRKSGASAIVQESDNKELFDELDGTF
jgi:four helix bundle protein